jgi:NAD(P)-dependent dehydrogenase (short-subunit alcohol dehydrogenase family)
MGSNALVIGGTTGIGRNISDQLIVRGYEVTTISRSGGDRENDYQCDVGDIPTLKDILIQISSGLESIDLLSCVVGFARARQTSQLTVEDWNETMAKNLTYVNIAFNELAEFMKKSEDPRVITFGSRWSYQTGCEELQPYIVAKHALRSLVEDLARRNDGLKINNFCVPTMDTPGFRFVRDSFIDLSQGVTRSFKPVELVEPTIVARSIVDYALRSDETGRILVVNHQGNISSLEQSMHYAKVG